ncbi:unnamed protein product [Effrenium voratum]|nr:unnamed protein product [Effrenium voratum]
MGLSWSCWPCRPSQAKNDVHREPVSVMQDVDLGAFVLHIETWPNFRVGSSAWPSGFLLAQALAEGLAGLPSVGGRRVAELGAGPGLPGLAAAKLGATQVLLTDYDELVPLLQRNILHNGLSNCHAEAFDWQLAAGSDLATRDGVPLDIILAADVVYFEEQDPLVDALKELMVPEHTVLVLAYRERTPADRLYVEDVILPNLQAVRVDFETAEHGSCEIYVGRWRSDAKSPSKADVRLSSHLHGLGDPWAQ